MTIPAAIPARRTAGESWLVIIAAVMFTASAMAAGAAPSRATLTTLAGVATTQPASVMTAGLPAASPTTASLTTVIIEGSTAYQPARLFTSYRDVLGRPVSRDSVRAVAGAIAALYLGDGYVKPEVIIDERLAAQGILRARVHEARVASVIFEGDSGTFRDQLEDIGARLEAPGRCAGTRPQRCETCQGAAFHRRPAAAAERTPSPGGTRDFSR